jgi:hypothetical protein
VGCPFPFRRRVASTHHKPVWPHHLPMTLASMAWLGGRAVALAAN